MDDDIQFGDVEEKRPDKSLRPDRNAHFCCISMGAPAEVDLPIFVDLDALLDMEDHSKSDMRVELGGVMLGGHYEDDEGKPFVVITDTLRAQHYESTKGSFKFTHDTWAEISRRRDAYPTTTHMVGWYHTHPDWGVFLSGMDLFICDHFFNKPLDVAYVIDPCRGHRGMFQWTEGADRKVRPTRGFYAIASRFRQNELAAYAALLEESAMSAELRRFSGPNNTPSVIQAIMPKDQMTQPILLMMMMLQFGLLAFLVWTSIGGQQKEQAETLVDLKKEVASLKETIQENSSSSAQELAFDAVLSELKDTEKGTAQKLIEQARAEKAMKAALTGQQMALDLTQKENNLYATQVKTLQVDLKKSDEALKKEKESVAALTEVVEDKAKGAVGWRQVFASPWAWVGMFLAAFVGAGIAIGSSQSKTRQEEIEPREAIVEPRAIDQ